MKFSYHNLGNGRKKNGHRLGIFGFDNEIVYFVSSVEMRILTQERVTIRSRVKIRSARDTNDIFSYIKYISENLGHMIEYKERLSGSF